jgi:hypothetical protein
MKISALHLIPFSICDKALLLLQIYQGANCLSVSESELLASLCNYTPLEYRTGQKSCENLLLEKMLQYYTYHIDYFKEIKSHLVYEELFK